MLFTQPAQVDRDTRTPQITEQHNIKVIIIIIIIIIIINFYICTTRNRSVMEVTVGCEWQEDSLWRWTRQLPVVDVTPCSLVEEWRSFRGFCCFLHQHMTFATSCCVDLIRWTPFQGPSRDKVQTAIRRFSIFVLLRTTKYALWIGTSKLLECKWKR